jgi:hypothetical protein
MMLKDWEARWKLNGDHLHCTSCKVAQWTYNASQSFLHDLDCKNQRGQAEYPWKDLVKIMHGHMEP